MDLDLRNTLFASQRLQVLHVAATTDLINLSYAYAWETGVYPYLDDGDSSTPIYPHEQFNDIFPIPSSMVQEVIELLDRHWLNKKDITFYDLENTYSDRCTLIHICKYAYLKNLFDDEFWASLIAPMKSPTEARSILRKYHKSDISVL